VAYIITIETSLPACVCFVSLIVSVCMCVYVCVYVCNPAHWMHFKCTVIFVSRAAYGQSDVTGTRKPHALYASLVVRSVTMVARSVARWSNVSTSQWTDGHNTCTVKKRIWLRLGQVRVYAYALRVAAAFAVIIIIISSEVRLMTVVSLLLAVNKYYVIIKYEMCALLFTIH